MLLFQDFITFFHKSIDICKKILYYLHNFLRGVILIQTLLNLFFLVFSFNIFVFGYTIYIFLEKYVFHKKQGSKLELKKDSL